MRVTILTDRYAPEARAAAYLSRELAEGLAARGHDVNVITRMPTQYVPEASSEPAASSEASTVTVRRVKALSGSSKIWLRALDQLLVSLKIWFVLWSAPKADVLLVYSPPLLLSLAAVLQRVFRGWRYILNLHDLYPQTAIDLGVLRNPLLIRIASLIERLVYSRASRIVVAAPASRRILISEQNIPPERVELIWNYIDTSACKPGPVENGFRKQHGLEEQFVVLYAGLMGLAQDLSPVIEVARRVQNDPSWIFVLAGDGPCASKWTRMAADLKNVRIIGPLRYAMYYQALQAADVCLVTLASSFKAPAVPGKVPTIMAAGRPIVASVPLGNDTRQILVASSAGIAVEPEDPGQLLAALQELASSPDLRRLYGQNGARYAAAHFDVGKAVKRFDDVIQEVLHRNRPSVTDLLSKGSTSA